MDIRKAVEEDIDVLSELRKQQLIDEGIEPSIDIDQELKDYFLEHLNKDLVEYVMEDDGEIVATAALFYISFPPSYTNRTGIRGYVTNMYTAPTHRKQGLAGKLIECLKQNARDRGVSLLFLSASEMGKNAYRRVGFVDKDNYFELKL